MLHREAEMHKKQDLKVSVGVSNGELLGRQQVADLRFADATDLR
jgi:hypothetical protein